MISDNYVIVMVIYCPLHDYGISGINIYHSMLTFHNEDSVLIYKEPQGIFPTTIFTSLATYNRSVTAV